MRLRQLSLKILGSVKKIITRNIFLLSFVSLFADIAGEMLFPITPIFLASIGYGAFFIGTLEGFAEFVAGISKGYFGQQSDLRRTRAPFVRLGYALSALSKPLIGLSNSPASVFFSRFSDRLGKGMRSNARDAWLADESAPEHRARVFGFHRGMDTLGAAIGPMLALGYLWAFPRHYRSLYFLAFIPAAIGAALTFFAKEKKHHQYLPAREAQKVASKNQGFFSFLKYWPQASPGFRRTSLFLIIFCLVNSSDALLILLAAKNLGDERQVIMAYILYNLLYSFLSYPFGAMADKFGMSKTFSFGLVFFAATYALMPFAHSFAAVLAAFALYAVFAASTESIAKAWLTKLVAPTEKGTALGFFTASQSTCLLLSSLWTGLLWQATRAEIPFLISATVALGLAFAIFKRGDGLQDTEDQK